MSLNIYLAGKVRMELDGDEVVQERQFRGRQSRQVFAYLVLERGRPTPKDELARVIWREEEAPPAWEVALSALVSRLRGLLTEETLGSLGLSISNDFGQYQMHLPPGVWVDMEFCADSLDRAESSLRMGEHTRVLGPAFVASTIARMPFLAGDEGDWVVGQRARMQRQLMRATDCLVRLWTLTGEPALAVETATEGIRRDPYREASYQLLMRAHDAAGHRAEAINTYHRLRRLLAEDLGTSPSPDTEAVYLALLG